MKKFISTGLALCLTSNIALARPMPSACPNVSAIKSVPSMTAIELFGGYFASTLGSFGTNDYWVFTMGIIEAKNEADALKKADKIKRDLSGHPIPQQDQGGDWSCQYSLPGEYGGFAVTSDAMLSKTKVAQYFRR